MSSPNRPARRSFVRAALATLGAFSLSDSKAGLFGGLLEAKSPYPVKSSGLLFGRKIGVQPIYWLDNDRALFPAYAPPTAKSTDGQEKMAALSIGLYI